MKNNKWRGKYIIRIVYLVKCPECGFMQQTLSKEFTNCVGCKKAFEVMPNKLKTIEVR